MNSSPERDPFGEGFDVGAQGLGDVECPYSGYEKSMWVKGKIAGVKYQGRFTESSPSTTQPTAIPETPRLKEKPAEAPTCMADFLTGITNIQYPSPKLV